MAELCAVSIPVINQHLKRIFSDNDLEESAVVKQCLTTAAGGKETLQPASDHCRLAIAADSAIRNFRIAGAYDEGKPA